MRILAETTSAFFYSPGWSVTPHNCDILEIGTRATITLFLPTGAASVLPCFCAPEVNATYISSVDWTRRKARRRQSSDIPETTRTPRSSWSTPAHRSSAQNLPTRSARHLLPSPTRCATRSTCGQALDFWNQNGQEECLLLCRSSCLKDDESRKELNHRWHTKAPSSSLRCSFRHKPKDQVEPLLAGPRGVSLCTSCVDCCQQVMQKEREKQPVSPHS